MFSTLNEQIDMFGDDAYIALSEKETYSPIELIGEMLEGTELLGSHDFLNEWNDRYGKMYTSDGAMATGVDMPTSEYELSHLDMGKYGSPGAEIFSIFNKDYTGLGQSADEVHDIDQNLEGSFEMDGGTAGHITEGLNSGNIFDYILGESELESTNGIGDFEDELRGVRPIGVTVDSGVGEDEDEDNGFF